MKIMIRIGLFILVVGVFYCLYMLNLTLDTFKNLAIILGVIVSLVVYITNSIYQYKQRISDNAIRYITLHDKLFENNFLKNNIQAMEDGSFERKSSDEKSFNRLLGEIEHLAFLTKMGVVSKSMNIYMFGWFAQHIQPVLTENERKNIYWEMAVEFLDDLKNDADSFSEKTKQERKEYFNTNHFFH